MRNLKLFSIAIVTLSFFAACAKQESSTASSTTPEPTSVQREAEVLPPTEPTEAVDAETTTASEEPVQQSAATQGTSSPGPAPAGTPAPMLPRRGDVASMTPEAQQPKASDPAASQRITVADAWEILKAGNGVLVDVRTADAYQQERIKGAVSIPYNEIGSRAAELPQDKWIITYCTCPAEESSGAAATTLKNMGFERVAAMLGGMQAWRGASLPVNFGQ